MHYGRTLPTRELKLSLPFTRKHHKDDYSQLEAALSQLPFLTVEYEKPPEAEMAEALAEQLGVTKKIFQARPSPLSCRAPTIARNVCNVPAARSPPEGSHHTDIITAQRHEDMTSTAQAELEQERTALEKQLEEQRAENERALAAQRAENERALAAQREEAERREAEAQAERQKMQERIDAAEAQGRQAQADKEQLLEANKELKRSLDAMNKKQTKMQEEMRQQEDRIKTQLEEKFRDDMAKLQAQIDDGASTSREAKRALEEQKLAKQASRAHLTRSSLPTASSRPRLSPHGCVWFAQAEFKKQEAARLAEAARAEEAARRAKDVAAEQAAKLQATIEAQEADLQRQREERRLKAVQELSDAAAVRVDASSTAQVRARF